MLFPRAHSRTQRQKRFVIGAVVIALVSFAAVICAYEGYYRGPSESAFFGTWETVLSDSDSPSYIEFRSDQTLRFSLSPSMGDVEEAALPVGKWYAGGPNIYVRFDAPVLGPSRPQVWHIVDITHDEFRVCYFYGGPVHIYKRVVSAATPRI
jgi:hypothetical protein